MPSPFLALDSVFPRINGVNFSLFSITEDPASLATPPTPSGPVYRAESLSGGHPSAARLRPVLKFVWSVCRFSFVFARPPGFQGTSGTGDPDTVSACRPADDSSSRIGSESRSPVEPQSMGAERAISGDVSLPRDNAPWPLTVRSATRSASVTQCPHRAALRASTILSEATPPSNFNRTHVSMSRETSCWFGNPPPVFAVDSVGVCRRRRFVLLRGAIYYALKDTSLPRQACTGAHTEHFGIPIAQAHRTEHPGF